MTGHRTLRLNEQFKREISAILSRKARDPRVGGVLVTEVRVTSDLWVARVYFRLMDAEVPREEAMAGLEAAAPFIRKELGKFLRIRRIPELRFQFDSSLDSATRIEELLREVLPEDGGDEGEEGTPTGSQGADEGGPETER